MWQILLLCVSCFLFRGNNWSWACGFPCLFLKAVDRVGKRFQFRRCEPIGLALNKGIIESETWGNPVLVDLVHIPSDLFWHVSKTNGNLCKMLWENGRSVSIHLPLGERGKYACCFVQACSGGKKGQAGVMPSTKAGAVSIHWGNQDAFSY